MNGWQYYEHAAIPSTPPHEPVNMQPINDGSIWDGVDGKKPWLIRWTSDFDCGKETNWWYVIKDAPFDISELKSKRRYEINKGIRHFEVREISPEACAEDIFRVAEAAFSVYPPNYRPNLEHDAYTARIRSWRSEYDRVYGAFDREEGKLCAYACLKRRGSRCLDFQVLKTDPAYEKFGLNAAVVYQILSDFRDDLQAGCYLCDGSRNIQHETAFQDYLEKYFCFRKAYCRLHVLYRGPLKAVIRLTYPFRRPIAGLRKITVFGKLNALLNMEQINRSGGPDERGESK